MHKIVKVLMVGVISIGVVFISAVIAEMKLERDHAAVWAARYKQVQPYYWWSLVTHDGNDVGGTHGPLKIALHPFVTYVNLPNQKTENFTIDELGFRKTGTEKRPGAKKVILLGGSTAFGTGLNSDGETIARYLEEFLGVEVINAAVIGHASGQELVYLLTELTDHKPDLVVSFGGHNDYARYLEGSNPRLLGTNNAFNQVEEQLKSLKRLGEPSLVGKIVNSSMVVFPRLTDRIKRSRLSLWVGSSGNPRARDDQLLALTANVYAKNMIKMSQMSKVFHYNFLCVLQPDRERHDLYRSFREIAKARLLENAVNYLDLNDMTELNAAMFMDYVHTDAIGNRLMAGQIAEKINKSQLLSAVR